MPVPGPHGRRARWLDDTRTAAAITRIRGRTRTRRRRARRRRSEKMGESRLVSEEAAGWWRDRDGHADCGLRVSMIHVENSGRDGYGVLQHKGRFESMRSML